MKKPPRRANVLGFNGEHKDEVVTQAVLRDLGTAQRAEWLASRRAILLSQRVKAAKERGAKFERGPLYFDEELEMVRSRKKENASDGGQSKKKESAG